MGVAAKLYRIDDRRGERMQIAASATLREANAGALDALVSDISDFGFRAKLTDTLAVGDRIGLELPSLGIVESRVAWRAGSQYGFAFLRPINGVIAFSAMREIDEQETAAKLATPEEAQAVQEQAPEKSTTASPIVAILGLALLLAFVALFLIGA